MITLLTDFGLKDEYVGVMKGVILSIAPKALLVDLSHEIPPGDIRQAGWLLSWAWSYFPRGTVHLVVVDPGVGSDRRILCFAYRGHLFLAPDNGVLSLLLRTLKHPRLYAVTNQRYALRPIAHTFQGRDIFAPVAAYLSKGLSPSRLGPRVSRWRHLAFPRAVQNRQGDWKGQIIQIDRFGNAMTNLPALALSPRPRKVFSPFRLRVKGRRLEIKRSYQMAGKSKAVAIPNSRGLLEIAVQGGSASQRLGLKISDPVLLSTVAT